MASCFKSIDLKSASDPNIVNVVLDSNLNALYFSRSIIPYASDERERVRREYFGHIGTDAYSLATLRAFCAFNDRGLENTEKLEQLRALSAGQKIAMLKISTKSMGIDTKEDYETAAKIYGFEAKI